MDEVFESRLGRVGVHLVLRRGRELGPEGVVECHRVVEIPELASICLLLPLTHVYIYRQKRRTKDEGVCVHKCSARNILLQHVIDCMLRVCVCVRAKLTNGVPGFKKISKEVWISEEQLKYRLHVCFIHLCNSMTIIQMCMKGAQVYINQIYTVSH